MLLPGFIPESCALSFLSVLVLLQEFKISILFQNILRAMGYVRQNVTYACQAINHDN